MSDNGSIKKLQGGTRLISLKKMAATGKALNPRLGFWGAVCGALWLTGCSNKVWLPSSGPSVRQIDPTRMETQQVQRLDGIQIVEVNDSIARKLLSGRRQSLFSESFAPATGAAPTGFVVGAGDVVEVSVWEAPSALLFGSGMATDARYGPATTRVTSFA